MICVIKSKPHDRYKRREADLIKEEEISLKEALTGGKFTIDHLCGKMISLEIEPNTILKPGELMIIEGEGLPQFRSPGKFGNLYLLISVKFPKELDGNELGDIIQVKNK